jgi:hypothetical protein
MRKAAKNTKCRPTIRSRKLRDEYLSKFSIKNDQPLFQSVNKAVRPEWLPHSCVHTALHAPQDLKEEETQNGI